MSDDKAIQGAVVTAGTITKGTSAATVGAKPAAAAPSKSNQPAAPSGPQPLNITRRSFFSTLGLGWLAFSGAMGAGLTAMGRFMFPNVLFEPVQSFKAGFPSDYTVGKVDERWKEKYAVWIVRNDTGLYALSTVCTHLGCTPNWLPAENKFKCPCHGSGYYMTGVNFEGPAPRPLERFKIVLGDDGQIFIDKNQKFQQEKGQWDDPESFLRYTG
jgi:cytochrome b6-f complex iron-sulfur subunit